MVSSMCILSGRLSSTTNGPVTSPKEIFPETRSELMARILARPPRAAKTLAITSFGVWAAAAAGSRERSAMQRVLSLMEFMVAAEHSEWRVASEKLAENASMLPENLRRVGVHTLVVTRSMRNRLRPQGIEVPRGAYGGRKQ